MVVRPSRKPGKVRSLSHREQKFLCDWQKEASKGDSTTSSRPHVARAVPALVIVGADASTRPKPSWSIEQTWSSAPMNTVGLRCGDGAPLDTEITIWRVVQARILRGKLSRGEDHDEEGLLYSQIEG